MGGGGASVRPVQSQSTNVKLKQQAPRVFLQLYHVTKNWMQHVRRSTEHFVFRCYNEDKTNVLYKELSHNVSHKDEVQTVLQEHLQKCRNV